MKPPSGPEHIAIVMDGNGRWAEQRKRPRTMGHQAGVRTAKHIVRSCGERGVRILTMFAFSSENWQRPQSEVSRLMELFMRSLRREVDELHENKVRLRFIGDRSPLAPDLCEAMARVEALTADNDGLRLVIAMNYGGRWDITEATRRIAEAVDDGRLSPAQVDEDMLKQHLSLFREGDPDLLIRTGGEKRVSNFLLWQLAYTELYFSDALWPDFDDTELDRALEDFRRRQRRFGRIAEEALERSRSA